MKEIRVFGCSDDTIQFTGLKGDPDFGAFGNQVFIEILDQQRNGFILVAQYAPPESGLGTWLIGIQSLAEDEPNHGMPESWKVSIKNPNDGETSYSQTLSINVPDDCILQLKEMK